MFRFLIEFLFFFFEERDHFLDRKTFFVWLWQLPGLIGIYEGCVWIDADQDKNFEIEPWTVDSAEAPLDRDWIDEQEQIQAELFFSTKEHAFHAAELLKKSCGFPLIPPIEQKEEDWDAKWKADFLNSGEGIFIPPFWRVVPPWKQQDRQQHALSEEKWIKINPGAGFGTGSHETSQLCLEAIGTYVQKKKITGLKVLDFGSGSGILSIAMALLGAQVTAVEKDMLALENSRDNARLNGVSESIYFFKTLPEKLVPYELHYDIIVANVLKPVLIEFSEKLTHCLKENGILILSGLIEKDYSGVLDQYRSLLKDASFLLMEKGEWRALVFENPTKKKS